MTRRDHGRVVDRREAIALALRMATPHDVVVLAGKGHETYQIRGTTSYPFDEREIVNELLAERTAMRTATVPPVLPNRPPHSA